MAENGQDRLRLRVAKAHVVFEQLGSARGQHDSGEQDAGERRTCRHHGRKRRLDDRRADLRFERGGQARRRGVSPHAAGVRAGVALADPLVVLRAAQPAVIEAVAQRKAADFFAGEEFFDHHPRPGRTEATREAGTNGVFSLGSGLGDDHTLARRQTIGLDNHRQIKARQRAQGVFGVVAVDRCSGRDAVVLGEAFDESLGAFELGSSGRRANHGDPLPAQIVGQTRDQRCFRANHHQIDPVFPAACSDGGVVVQRQRQVLRQRLRPRIARGDEHFSELRRGSDGVGQRVFTAATADDQHLHGSTFPSSFAPAPLISSRRLGSGRATS